MKSILTAVAALSLFVSGSALACEGSCAKSKGTQTAGAAQVQGEKLAVFVSNATCTSCVDSIKTALVAGLKGVLDVRMEADDPKNLVVVFEKGAVASDAIVAAIKKAGFEAAVRTGNQT